MPVWAHSLTVSQSEVKQEFIEITAWASSISLPRSGCEDICSPSLLWLGPQRALRSQHRGHRPENPGLVMEQSSCPA